MEFLSSIGKNQLLWCSKHIQVGGSYVFYPHWYNAGIICLGDLLDPKNNFLSLGDLVIKYNLQKFNYLEYYGLCRAIPRNWKSELKKNVSGKTFVADFYPRVEIKGIIRNIQYVSNNDLYWTLLNSKNHDPITSELLWCKEFNIVKKDLETFFYVPYQYSRETKIQTLQYKILHFFYPCRLKLYHWKIKNSSICIYCNTNSTDNLFHHFFNCQYTFAFWSSLQTWWKQFCRECCFCDLKDIMLGVVHKVCHKPQINFLILHGKWYIYRTKYLEQRLSFLDFLVELKTKLNTEKFIYFKAKKDVKFFEMWQNVYDAL